MFFKYFFSKKPDRIYLDFASSTPVDMRMIRTFPVLPKVAMQANPSSIHYEGVLAKNFLSKARTIAAQAIGAHENEIIYTSGATESDNLALLGSIQTWLNEGVKPQEICVIISDIEHAAVLETQNHAGHMGIQTIKLETVEGIVNTQSLTIPDGIKKVLVSVMYVNNEIGTVQPIIDIAKRVRFLRKHNPSVEIYFHVDATQAPLYFNLNVSKLGVDMMTLGATKLYCPKGVGILFKKRTIRLSPISFGGGQEFGYRPGTQSLYLIHLFSHSLSYAQKHYEKAHEDIKKLQIYFESKLSTVLPGAMITGSHSVRTPHISHIAFKGFDSELLVLELDAKNISVSAKSACKNEDENESEIISKIFGQGVGGIRISYGRHTTQGQLDKVMTALQAILKKYTHA